MENSTNEVLERIHSRLGWIAILLFLLVCGVGIGILLDPNISLESFNY
jgi:hypothetical protein